MPLPGVNIRLLGVGVLKDMFEIVEKESFLG